jgi:hypothetical protein
MLALLLYNKNTGALPSNIVHLLPDIDLLAYLLLPGLLYTYFALHYALFQYKQKKLRLTYYFQGGDSNTHIRIPKILDFTTSSTLNLFILFILKE